MKRILPYLGLLLGVTLLAVLVARANIALLVQTVAAGGCELLWLIPYRGLFFFLYAVGWLILLECADPQRRASLGYLFWVTTIREGVDRLLPVASVGGSVIGVRLLRWKSLGLAPVTASIVVEIVMTLIASYVFTVLGLALLLHLGPAEDHRRLLILLAASLPVPFSCVLLLRYGSIFQRLQAILPRLVGKRIPAPTAIAVDGTLRAILRRRSRLVTVTALQSAALISASFEVWFAMRLFGHPIDAAPAIALESLTQAARHLAFIIPGGLGVQEAGLVLVGHVLGVDGELALAVSMAKRGRELAWGLPSLLSWQWAEARRFQSMAA